MRHKPSRHIAVIGGSYAGHHAARYLAKRNVECTVFDPLPYFEWLPNIHELVSGFKQPADLRIERRSLARLHGYDWVPKRVAQFDANTGLLATDTGMHGPFDAFIVCIGGVNNDYGIAGVMQHAFPFKSVNDCWRIHLRLRDLLGRPARIVIAGAGVEGVEGLGEVLRLMAQQPAATEHWSITVVDRSQRPLRQLPAAAGDIALAKLQHPRLTWLWGTSITGVSADAIATSEGALPCDICIWTGGVAPASIGKAQQGNWWTVDTALCAAGEAPAACPVLVAGDIAQTPTATAKQAAEAMAMGDLTARNALRALAGKPRMTWRSTDKPQLITLGDNGAIMVWRERVFHHSSLGLLKEAVLDLQFGSLLLKPKPAPLWRLAGILGNSTRELYWPAIRSLLS